MDLSEVGLEVKSVDKRYRSAAVSRHYKQNGSPYAGGSSSWSACPKKVASGMGTVPFIVISSLIIFGWVFANGAAHYVSQTVSNLGTVAEFDPEPWILLNLVFSGVAFFTGALVIIAQKAQTRTDKANEEASAKHREELDTVPIGTAQAQH